MVSEEEKKPPRRRWRRIIFIVLCGVPIFLVPLVWFWQQAHARYTVVGKTDPVTGYHAIYTVSQRWKKTTPTINVYSAKTKFVELSQFNPPAPNALQTWINAHVFHRTSISKTRLGGFIPDNSIQVYALLVDSKQPYLVEDIQGYVSLKSLQPQIHILQQERLRISGHPATSWVLSVQYTPSQQLYEHIILVKPLHQPILFELFGQADNEAQFREILQEMTAIRDSLRIEK